MTRFSCVQRDKKRFCSRRAMEGERRRGREEVREWEKGTREVGGRVERWESRMRDLDGLVCSRCRTASAEETVILEGENRRRGENW